MNVLRIEAELLRTLGHPFRLQLLEMLAAEETCVCHLSAYFAKPQPYVSKQLAQLRDAGLVVDRREGQRVYYSLSDPSLSSLLEAVQLAGRRLSPKTPMEPERPLPRYPVAGCECPRCNAA